MDNENKEILITKDDGTEVKMEILFTIESPEFNKKYVLYTDPADDEGNVYCSSYNEETFELAEVETEEEWEFIEIVLEEWQNEEENEEE